MKPLRTGIIGCGNIAKRHAEILRSVEDVCLVGFCDTNLLAARQFAEQYGSAEVFEDYEKMFDQLNLDLVYICLPPFAHDKEVESACNHGVHILLEKPIALNIKQAEAMAGHVNKSGVKCQVGFMYRFGEAAIWLKNQFTTKEKSKAFMIARYSCNSLHSWWWRDKSKSGGQLVEQAIHLLDLTRFFLGEPVQVYSLQDNLFHRNTEGYTVEDASATVIRFDSGSIAVVAATNGAIPNRWDCDWRIMMPNLTADFVDPNHATIHLTGASYPNVLSIAAEKNIYLAQTLDLLEAVKVDRPTWVPIEEGVRSLGLALNAAGSAEKQTIVDLA